MKNILVTGASSGIGEAIARYLSAEGYCVVLVARNEEKLNRLSSELPNKSYCFKYDLTELDNIESIFKFCADNELKLDGLVHSAGMSTTMPIKFNEIANMERMFRVNYFSFEELTKFFAGKKYSNSCSSIVAISSMATMANAVGQSLYASSKSALNSFVKISAKEYVKRRIRINAIMPANVVTPMTSDLENRIPADITDTQPYGMIPAEQIAYLAEFLLSDKAEYITGATIPVSAGMIY